MGTRADFYVGRGVTAEWLGSVAWDGYPDGFDRPGLLDATTEAQYRAAVSEELASREDATLPEAGWPWPWDNSATTDYAYAFDGERVYSSCFGRAWHDLATAIEDESDEDDASLRAVFPDMSARKNVAFGSKSGVIVVHG
ncbi:hypothetical protein [Pandoraea apista]|uniref:hypothetical protein n=1 Tax=Pandoraea apista TaxID=93218 RepID=UPI000658FA70|nr:hypothetical protein [Pandoraea apista]ALS64908.1 hypothetical protein AT395_07860 [Pandoraea apista]CFB65270.1 hypothetical protein LMG16407_04775 [Pandoraea apista]